MSAEEFFGMVLVPNMGTYFIILFLTILLYVFIYRKYYLSIIDPMIMPVIYSLFGFSVVFLLFFTDNMSNKLFLSYIYTQLAFWIGLYFGNKNRTNIRFPFFLKNELALMKCIFFVSLMIYIGTTLLGYLILGVPILFQSRLDVAANAKGGMGILTRFASLNIVCLYTSFFFYFSKSKDKVIKILQYISIISFCIFSILGGSKSGFLLLALIYFCFVIINRDQYSFLYDNLQKKQYSFMLYGFVAAIIVIILTTGYGASDSFGMLLYRLVGSGDVYWMAYPNNMISDIPYRNPFVVLFQSFLGFFRLLSHDNFPEPIGYKLSSFFYEKTALTGANARHNIFGYVYFGAFGCIIFSFVIGFLIGKVRSIFVYRRTDSKILRLVIVLLYINVFSLETDPTLYFSYLTDLLIILPIVLFLSLLLYKVNYASNSNIISDIQQ